MDTFKKVGVKLWVHKDGKTFSVELQGPQTARASSLNTHSDGLLKSPMPGKILKIQVGEGDLVRQGQTLCVIEAMKMEYALKAPFAGLVKEIAKKPGDLVRVEEKVIVLGQKT